MAAIKILSELGDAVVAAVQAGILASAFSQTFAFERSWADWELPLDDADKGELRLDVVPVNNPTVELAARGKVEYTVPVDLVVRQKLNVPQQDDLTGRIRRLVIDDLVGLVLELERYFIKDRFDDYPGAVWEKSEIRAAYIGKHLRDYRQFTGVVRLTFSVTKTI